ncbi:hypothetical protein [Phenylobacterium deserti]|uniref:Uncharacterized protein n=1 Tax=Phenylobacterium deserti TaxID=1914756 RepID=A0A328AD52_9CAUL|nr:hypothetical protein [Phenylobacterium deserti]RAK52570.1 hypothetical protein DJ018_10175 [Phenylobacterium deserti]
MDELEQSVFALELLVMLRLSMDDPDRVRQMADAIRVDLDDSTPMERRIRQRALEMLTQMAPAART